MLRLSRRKKNQFKYIYLIDNSWSFVLLFKNFNTQKLKFDAKPWKYVKHIEKP